MTENRFNLGFGILALLAITGTAPAQPWVFFEDGCSIVSTVDDAVVVLDDTGELVVVSGVDVILDGTFVDLDNTVFVDGLEFGFIQIADDADGVPSLWWVVGPEDRVVHIDDFGQFIESDFFPEDLANGGCSACELWDIAIDCDEDLDGIDDDFDLCLGTPEGEPVDDDGCSCFDFDSDDDGVVDCFDDCPDTPPGEVVEADGCSCFDFDSDRDEVNDCFDDCPGTPLDLAVDDDGCPIVVDGGGGGGGGPVFIACGALGPAALALTFLGLGGLKLIRRRA